MQRHATIVNIRVAALQNTDYRRVIDTTPQMQQVLMYITPTDGGIDRESHTYSTQIISVIAGNGDAIIDGQSVSLPEGSAITIPANTVHEIFNYTSKPLILHTIYAPPVHEPGVVQRTRRSNEELQERTQVATQSFEEPGPTYMQIARRGVIRRLENELEALGGNVQRQQSLENMSEEDMEAHIKQLRKSIADENAKALQKEADRERAMRREAALRRIARRRNREAFDPALGEQITDWESQVFDLEGEWPERPQMTTRRDIDLYIASLKARLI